MKTLSNISNMHLNDAFIFASSISGRQRKELTLGDVYTTFNTIAQMVSRALGETATSDAVPQPKKRGRPPVSSKARANAQPKKRGRPPVSDKAKPGPKGETINKSGSPRAPRGKRKEIVLDVIRACGGEAAFAAVAKAVITREGAQGEAQKSVHAAVYQLLGKLVESGEAEIVTNEPKTLRLKAVPAQEKGELELVTS